MTLPEVPGDDVEAQAGALRRYFPRWYDCLDPSRIEQVWTRYARDDFGPSDSGGRGHEYIRAQTAAVSARFVGIREVMTLALRHAGDRELLLVDLLGGDGLLRRACGLLGFPQIDVLTCDASPLMVATAWASSGPALLQLAERPLLRSESVDVVVLAYGSHHIPVDRRGTVAMEAYRVLRPGGVFILHDFLVGSPAESWFTEVVDRYSRTGHDYPHFTEAEICGYLSKAGFDDYRLLEIDDPYHVTATTCAEAERQIGEYLLDMYGLVRAESAMGRAAAREWVLGRAEEIFLGSRAHRDLTSYDTSTGRWRALLPRRAIVGLGLKSE
jgi:SAM-dependent methyltransferase